MFSIFYFPHNPFCLLYISCVDGFLFFCVFFFAFFFALLALAAAAVFVVFAAKNPHASRKSHQL
jgi:hypothetical protein